MKIKAGTAFIGEIGLGGELRGVKNVDQRIAEAQKMGFSTVIVPNTGVRKSSNKSKTTKESPSSRLSSNGKANDPTENADTSSSSSGEIVKCSNLYQALTVALEVESFSEITQKLRGTKTKRSPSPTSQRTVSTPSSRTPYYSSSYQNADDVDDVGDKDSEVIEDEEEEEDVESYGNSFTGNMGGDYEAIEDEIGTLEEFESPYRRETSGTSSNPWQGGDVDTFEGDDEGNDIKEKPPVKSRRPNSRYDRVGSSNVPSGAVRSSSSSSSSSINSANAGWKTIRKGDKDASQGIKYIIDDGQGGAMELNSNSRKPN
jgi:hypothetical protein